MDTSDIWPASRGLGFLDEFQPHAPQAILARDLRIHVLEVPNRWQHDLWGKRERSDRSPRRDGPIDRVGAVSSTPLDADRIGR